MATGTISNEGQKTKELPITYVTNSLTSSVGNCHAYRKNGILLLVIYLGFNATASISDYTTIGSISGWAASGDVFVITNQQSSTYKNVQFRVKADGTIQVYSSNGLTGDVCRAEMIALEADI
jgi:hypothetical protein